MLNSTMYFYLLCICFIFTVKKAEFTVMQKILIVYATTDRLFPRKGTFRKIYQNNSKSLKCSIVIILTSKIK